VSKYEQSTVLLQIIRKRAMRNAQNRSASRQNVNDILLLNLTCCKSARMRFQCAKDLCICALSNASHTFFVQAVCN